LPKIETSQHLFVLIYFKTNLVARNQASHNFFFCLKNKKKESCEDVTFSQQNKTKQKWLKANSIEFNVITK
jgi:hypothetical protein